jgi:hypothetical protein
MICQSSLKLIGEDDKHEVIYFQIISVLDIQMYGLRAIWKKHTRVSFQKTIYQRKNYY